MYKFCKQLQSSVYFGFDTLVHCCSCDLDRTPTFIHYYRGQRINWKAVINEKLKLQEKAKKGKAPFSACANCHSFVEDEWDNGGYINEITVSHWTKCNCDCFYCYTARNKTDSNKRTPYPLLPLLQDMKNAGILRFDGIIRFLGGDVAMLDEFEDFMRFFLDNGAKNFYIPTSGIKYLPVISEVLEQGKGEVIISPDSGNRNLYKKIKRIDAYNLVRENMKKYAQSATIGNSVFRSKYLVLPYINDKKEYIDEWLQECIDLNIKYIADDIEDNFSAKYKKSIPEHIPELLNYIHQKADKYGLNKVRFRYASQMLYEIQNGTAKIAKNNLNYNNQKIFMEKLLNR